MSALMPSTLDVMQNIGEYKKQIGTLITGRSPEPRIERKINALLDAALDLQAFSGPKDAFMQSMDFRFRGIALELMRNVAPFLHQKNLLSKAFQVMPDPTACSSILQRALLNSESKSLVRYAEAVLALGTVMNADDMMSMSNIMRNAGLDEYDPVKLHPDLILRLMENMHASSWTNCMENEGQQWVANRFILDVLEKLSNQGHYKKVIDHFINKPEVYADVKSGRHAFILQLSLSVSDARYFAYLASADKSLYDKIVSSKFTQNHFVNLIISRSFEFDVGKLPDLRWYSARFFIDCFVEGTKRMSLTERQYKGLQHHWKLLGIGNGESLVEAASKMKEVKECVRKHQFMIEKLDSRIADKALFEQQDNSFYEYARGRYQLLEKFFIKPENRITGNIEYEKALFKSILAVSGSDCYEYVKKNRHLAQDSEVVDLMIRLKETSNKYSRLESKSDLYNYVIGLMIEDDPMAKPFLHLTKENFDKLNSWCSEFTPEVIRRLNWKSSLIKRETIESDLEL